MFEKIDTPIPGCYIIKPRVLTDSRGGFVKLFHNHLFMELGLNSDFKEEYYSTSTKGVVRGLHFQTPPHHHVKCITCLNGAIFDVVVDLRKDSSAFGKHFSLEIKSTDPKLLYIPEGMAHGFMALADNTIFLNKTTTVFNSDHDSGIHVDSCGIEWPELPRILSEKDMNFMPLNKFKSPFNSV